MVLSSSTRKSKYLRVRRSCHGVCVLCVLFTNNFLTHSLTECSGKEQTKDKGDKRKMRGYSVIYKVVYDPRLTLIRYRENVRETHRRRL